MKGGAPIPPGEMLGVLGGGQLGRMFAQAARRMGYRVAVWSDTADAPALAAADLAVAAPYDDPEAFERFTTAVAAVTVEFENLPLDLLRAMERRRPLRPGAEAVARTQRRDEEKAFLAELGVPLAPVRSLPQQPDGAAAKASLMAALAEVGCPAVLKTAGFGYDGKGQVRIDAPGEIPEIALALCCAEPTVVEAFVDLAGELSVLVARGCDGSAVAYPVAENHHRHHILDVTLMPARIDALLAAQAQALALRVIHGLGLVGLACVELFITRQGELWVNEIAPRPHNSGHISIEATSCDQFEQQVRALCALPLAEPTMTRPGAMANLLGDVWGEGGPDWSGALAVQGVRLHLYGKEDPRPGRKMGHLSALAEDAEQAAEAVLRARALAAKGAVPALPAAPRFG